MLELTLLEATIVACHAADAVLDAWRPERQSARVARDELWILGPRSERNEIVSAAERSLRSLAPGALVIDQTDGWTAWCLAGTDAAHAMARLTVMRMDRTAGNFHQGAVAGVPAKVFLTGADYRVFVPSPVGDHLRDRVLEACGDLQPTTGPARAFGGAVR